MTVTTGEQITAADALKLGRGIYGDGSDGDATITGTPTTLTRDMFYNSLTVNSGKELATAGFRVHVLTTLTNNGTISNNGGDGGNAADGVAGAAGAATGLGTLGASGAGAIGVTAANSSSSGGGGAGGGPIVIAAHTIDNSSGTIEANGGNAGTSSAGSVTGPQLHGNAGTACDPSKGGSGGAGGDDATKTGGAGGTATAAKSGARALPIAISLWETEATAGQIKGGGGGGSGAANGSKDNCGGSGGGGGGLIVLVYQRFTAGTETVTAGSKSSGVGTGDDGVDGSVGTIIKISNSEEDV